MNYYILKPYTKELYEQYKRDCFLDNFVKPDKNPTVILISKAVHEDKSETFVTVYALNSAERVMNITGDLIVWDYTGLKLVIWKNKTPYTFDEYAETVKEEKEEPKKKFRVWATVETSCYIDVEAETKEEAMEIADAEDGGSFISDEGSGAWNINYADEL